MLSEEARETTRHSESRAGGGHRPYRYRRHDLIEPDWRRFVGWRQVGRSEWESAQWQRAHCIKNVGQLRSVLGPSVPDVFYDDLAQDQAGLATMPLLLPPHLLNTISPDRVPDLDRLNADPVRRYMLPVASDRAGGEPSHPMASRDSLHEHEMWTVEGLTHRYPTKALLELLTTCPQYCGHCTRMDLVGGSTPAVRKLRFEAEPGPRVEAMLDYLRRTPAVRDVVLSGGDVANLPWPRLEQIVRQVLDIESIRDVRLASKALVGIPQHWLRSEVLTGMERLATLARQRGVQLALHTHVNVAQSITPLTAEASRKLLETGVRDVRNQGVLLRGVNDGPHALLDLCFSLLDNAGIIPYYFYMCDLIPNVEHFRLALWEAQELQDAIMGYLPGFATPRIVCDVPYLGKRWVHQVAEYDRELGISHWTKHYRTTVELDEPDVLNRRYQYYDPITTLPDSGRRWWSELTRTRSVENLPGVPEENVPASVTAGGWELR
jgi:lysine 2,3-aminomutase